MHQISDNIILLLDSSKQHRLFKHLILPRSWTIWGEIRAREKGGITDPTFVFRFKSFIPTGLGCPLLLLFYSVLLRYWMPVWFMCLLLDLTAFKNTLWSCKQTQFGLQATFLTKLIQNTLYMSWRSNKSVVYSTCYTSCNICKHLNLHCWHSSLFCGFPLWSCLKFKL